MLLGTYFASTKNVSNLKMSDALKEAYMHKFIYKTMIKLIPILSKNSQFTY